MNKSKQNKPAALLTVAAAVIAALAIYLLSGRVGDPRPAAPALTRPPQAETSVPETEPEKPRSFELDEGIIISDFGPYSGIFMEDGSNDPVSDVMMLLLYNRTEQDLQYIRFLAESDGGVYTFEATNIAAGSSAVLLEQARQPMPDGDIRSASAEHIVFFDEPMACLEDSLEISGMDGALNIRNVSGGDLTGDIFVYYKYSAEDIFYGGITFRVVISGGLKDGELRQIPAGHYSPNICRIVQVVCNG